MAGRIGRALIAGMAAVRVLSSICSAQTIAPGTFEVSGVTSLSASRQTVSMANVAGQVQATNLDVTTITFGAEVTYYISKHLGLGGVVSHQRLSAEVPDQQAIADVASTYFGPFAQVRLPLGGRSTFALVGSYGGTMVTLINQNTGQTIGQNTGQSIGLIPGTDAGQSSDASTNQHLTATGKYWLLGGGLSLELSPSASFDFGVRYQSSMFNGAPGTGKTTAAGLLVNVAVSLYVGHH